MNLRRALLLAGAAALSGTGLFTVSAQSSPLNVSLVFDPAGRYDHGKNQSAQDGADRAVRDFGVNVDTYTPLDATDNKAGTVKLAREGSNLVIGVGSFHMAGLTAAAQQYPKTYFALVDGLPTGSNTAGIRFRDSEGAFLAGYIAGSTSATSVVGIVAEEQSPATAKFVAAFSSGVRLVCSGCRVIVGNLDAGAKPDKDTAKANTLTDSMMNAGADIIFDANLTGATGPISAVRNRQCVKEASLPAGVKFRSDLFAAISKSDAYKVACKGSARPVFFIGWQDNNNVLGDTDADPTTLNHGLTSIVRRVDNAVYSVIRDMVKGQVWRPGERAFGLQNGGLEYAVDKYNTALFPKTVTDRLAKVTSLVISGSVKIGQ
ncbi:BMP family ABC transporter substrate-binding protein [Deinococcus sp. KNUC1210]|nr:BMP family ABC transporter substrate-binding protein [Deinococcus sp. KNUC1210]ULH16846.1 BMP family ABC transporter substrate-binding protein [Deinococcus sp. KNUC1210]